MKIKNIFFGIALLGITLSSCDKEFLDTAPTNRLSSDVMFESIEGANLALNGMYRYMYAFITHGYANHDAFGYMATVLEMDLMGDDMIPFSAGYGWFNRQYQWTEHRNSDAGVTHLRWLNFYTLINNANLILTYIDDVVAPQAEINHIKAQAHSMRAFCYYQLLQMYAPAYHKDPQAPGVPIYITSVQEGNPRSTVAEGYQLIYADLTTAIELWGESVQQSHKSHISRPVAHGLFARAALARRDYDKALEQAQFAIDASSATIFPVSAFPPAFQTDTTIKTVAQLEAFIAEFPRNQLFNNASASEWMWGMVINEEHATIFASFFSHVDATTFGYSQLGGQKLISHGTEGLYNNISDTDVRKNLWLAPGAGNRYPAAGATATYMRDYNQMKYLTQELGAWPADYLFMRISEMHLIKAEAIARDAAGATGTAAQALYEVVSNRDPEYTLSTNTGQALIDEIMFHRRVELWGEGFRFIDIKRLGQELNRFDKGHDQALAIRMTAPADDNLFNWLIPRDEIDVNNNISAADQNP